MPPRRRAGNGGERRRGVPFVVEDDRGLKKPPDLREWPGGGRGVCGNSGPRTRIPRQLIGGNADELPKRTGNGGRMLGERVSPSKLPPIPAPIGPRGRWMGGGGGSPNRGTASRGQIPPPKDLPNVQIFGGRHPQKVCTFGRSPSPPSANSPTCGVGWPRIFNRLPFARTGAD